MPGLRKNRRRLGIALIGVLLLMKALSPLPGHQAAANDTPTVGFKFTAYTVSEAGASAIIAVILSADPGENTVQVTCATSDGTATAGEDYATVSQTLSFPSGTTEQTCSVPIVPDSLYEGNETVNLTLSGEVNATPGTSFATLTIEDDDEQPTVSFSKATYSEGESDGPASIQVQLGAESGKIVQVTCATSDGTATAGEDYATVSQTLTFPAGTTTPQTCSVPIVPDSLYEGNETVNLTLSGEVNATLGTSSATLTIEDDDEQPTVSFSRATYSEGEGDGPASIQVQLSAESGKIVQVTCATSDGTAKAPQDYAAVSQPLSFPPGTTEQTVYVAIVDDALDENNETVNLELSNASGAGWGIKDATLTIEDNDAQPMIGFASTSSTVGEGDGSKTIWVQLSTQSGRTVQVNYATSNGTAEEGSDYTATSGKLTFSAGDTAESFAVTILEDFLDENDETVKLTLSNASYANLGVKNATLTIWDNDGSGIVVAPTTLEVNEPNEEKSFNVSLKSEPTSQVTIGLSTSNAECKISRSSIELTPANWSSGVNVTVTAVDDDIDDGQQTCKVQTAPASSDDKTYDGENPDDVTVNVLDDDQADVQVTPTVVKVTEGGASDSYQVVLTSQPTQSVRITVSTDNQVTASPSQLTFDQNNWDRPKTVVVRAVDDSLAEGPHSGTISHSVTSNDGKYSGLKPSKVDASIQDNDGAQIIVDPTDLTISEPNGAAAFTIYLTSKPSSGVTIPLHTSNQQCAVSGNSVVLGSANWSSGASVTVSAVDDNLQDGDQICEVVTGLATSEDPNYDGRRVQDVTVSVLDDRDRQVFLPFVVANWPPLPAAPVLQPIDNSDGDGTYTIAWTSVPAATSYVLEEARDGAFGTAIEIYSGTSTTFKVSGQITGRYYHRVRARNSWGDGGWSGIQWADMIWEVEPNNQPSDANGPLISGLTYRGKFTQRPNQGNQFDYFYFDVASAGKVELWLRNIPASEDYNLVLRDASQQLVGYSAWGGNSNEYISETVSPGRYYVQIWHYIGEGDDRGYDLRVLFQ